MTPQRWQEVRDALHQAVELEPERRGCFSGMGAKVRSLRQEVELLLAAEEEVRPSFLESKSASGLENRRRLDDDVWEVIALKATPTAT